MHPFLKPLAALAALALACPGAHADWEIPTGGAARLGGGTARLGCASVSNSGALLAARDVRTHVGALLAVGAGRVELAQQWAAGGSVTLTTAQMPAHTHAHIATTAPATHATPRPPLTPCWPKRRTRACMWTAPTAAPR
jgi:microcystin-dependent protein